MLLGKGKQHVAKKAKSIITISFKLGMMTRTIAILMKKLIKMTDKQKELRQCQVNVFDITKHLPR